MTIGPRAVEVLPDLEITGKARVRKLQAGALDRPPVDVFLDLPTLQLVPDQECDAGHAAGQCEGRVVPAPSQPPPAGIAAAQEAEDQYNPNGVNGDAQRPEAEYGQQRADQRQQQTELKPLPGTRNQVEQKDCAVNPEDQHADHQDHAEQTTERRATHKKGQRCGRQDGPPTIAQRPAHAVPCLFMGIEPCESGGAPAADCAHSFQHDVKVWTAGTDAVESKSLCKGRVWQRPGRGSTMRDARR